MDGAGVDEAAAALSIQLIALLAVFMRVVLVVTAVLTETRAKSEGEHEHEHEENLGEKFDIGTLLTEMSSFALASFSYGRFDLFRHFFLLRPFVWLLLDFVGELLTLNVRSEVKEFRKHPEDKIERELSESKSDGAKSP